MVCAQDGDEHGIPALSANRHERLGEHFVRHAILLDATLCAAFEELDTSRGGIAS